MTRSREQRRDRQLPIPLLDGDVLARHAAPRRLALPVHLPILHLVLPEPALRLANARAGPGHLTPPAPLLTYELVAITEHLGGGDLGRDLIALAEHDLRGLLLELLPRDDHRLLDFAEFALAPLRLARFGCDPSVPEGPDGDVIGHEGSSVAGKKKTRNTGKLTGPLCIFLRRLAEIVV